jgi:hypothetical protein
VELRISDLSRLVLHLENQDQSRRENTVNFLDTTKSVKGEQQTISTDPSLLSVQTGLQSLFQGFQSALQPENQELANQPQMYLDNPCIQSTRASTISGSFEKASTPVTSPAPAKQTYPWADGLTVNPKDLPGPCNQQ